MVFGEFGTIAKKVVAHEPLTKHEEKYLFYPILGLMVIMLILGGPTASQRQDAIDKVTEWITPEMSQTKQTTEPAILSQQTGQANQIIKDRDDPVFAQRINRLETGGNALIPIANPPKEIQIGTSVYITDLTVNGKVSGFIENRGKKSINVNIGKIAFITKDYLSAAELPIIYINGQSDTSAALWFEPGQKKSFGTINTKDTNEYKKLGGIPEELKTIEQSINKASYLQIAGFGASDT